MTWTERNDLRTYTSKTWRDDAQSLKHRREHVLNTVLHYPTAGPDSDVLDGEVNFTFQHVTVGGRDLYRTNVAGWHYALGKDITGVFANVDGTVGFGGRQGAHWLKYRLARVGYLHWPTRAWDDVGGAPGYVRARLGQATDTLTLGPVGAESTVNISSKATWERIWSTPGGGQLDISWRVDGRHLKEEVSINQAAREWIAANRPPSTPAGETWFGFVFRLDVSDIPRWIKAGILQDINGDFSDDDGNIEIRDTLDRLLGFMPLSHAYSQDYDAGIPGDPGALTRDTVLLRKRIWLDGDGNHYLLVGARVDQLNAMHEGAITFDPTWDSSVEGWGDKDTSLSNTPANARNYGIDDDLLHGSTQRFLIEFDCSAISNTATCDSATLYLYVKSTTTKPALNIYSIAVGNEAWPEGTKNGSTGGTGDSCWDYLDQDASPTSWAGSAGMSTSGTDYEADSLGSIALTGGESLGDEKSTALTAARIEGWFGETNTNYGIVSELTGNGRSFCSSDHATGGYHPKLVIQYTEVGGQPFVFRTFGIPTGAGARNRPGGWN